MFYREVLYFWFVIESVDWIPGEGTWYLEKMKAVLNIRYTILYINPYEENNNEKKWTFYLVHNYNSDYFLSASYKVA